MRILLAEDERELSRALCAVLAHEGFTADAVYDGAAAVEQAGKAVYDCMILDVMMPVMDGVTALREIRASGDVTPVLFLTAKAETDDRVTGLDAGADDYLTKPFAMKELLARLRSLTRRTGGYASTKVTVGSTTLDTEEQELSCGNAVRLAGKEVRLLELLMRNPGKEIPTADIFARIWRDEPERGEGVVWIYISYLRQKLFAVGSDLEITGDQGGSFCLIKKEDRTEG